MLERILRSVAESYGLLHQSNLRVLRNYIKSTPEVEIVDQVNKIKEMVLLRTLWEAGLSSRLQDAVLSRLEKLG